MNESPLVIISRTEVFSRENSPHDRLRALFFEREMTSVLIQLSNATPEGLDVFPDLLGFFFLIVVLIG